jgi:hypothetical protein
MWSSLIPTAIAAAIIASVVNLASEISTIRATRQGAGIESTFPRDAPATDTQGSSRVRSQQKSVLEPGA